MEIKLTGCCGMNELHHFSDLDIPEKVVWQLCSYLWNGSVAGQGTADYANFPSVEERKGFKDYLGVWRSRYGDYWHTNDPKAFYLFSAVVGYKNDNAKICSNYTCGRGELLVNFIKRNRLGTVVEGPSRWNRSNSPSHKIRAWVWAPSERRLRDWWRENYKREEWKGE